jgi:REP element-mobilizing transposase RayT
MKSQNSFVKYLLSLAQDAENDGHHSLSNYITTFAKDVQRTKNPERLWEFQSRGDKIHGVWTTCESGRSPNWIEWIDYRRHPHADLMLEWERDQRENPNQVWQVSAEPNIWNDSKFDFSTVWDPNLSYRRKPKERRIGACVYPQPETKALEIGTVYFIPNPSSPNLVIASVWDDRYLDHGRLKNGLVHLSDGAAKTHAKSMINGWSEH